MSKSRTWCERKFREPHAPRVRAIAPPLLETFPSWVCVERDRGKAPQSARAGAFTPLIPLLNVA
jgi:hypothetical protein